VLWTHGKVSSATGSLVCTRPHHKQREQCTCLSLHFKVGTCRACCNQQQQITFARAVITQCIVWGREPVTTISDRLHLPGQWLHSVLCELMRMFWQWIRRNCYAGMHQASGSTTFRVYPHEMLLVRMWLNIRCKQNKGGVYIVEGSVLPLCKLLST